MYYLVFNKFNGIYLGYTKSKKVINKIIDFYDAATLLKVSDEDMKNMKDFKEKTDEQYKFEEYMYDFTVPINEYLIIDLEETELNYIYEKLYDDTIYSGLKYYEMKPYKYIKEEYLKDILPVRLLIKSLVLNLSIFMEEDDMSVKEKLEYYADFYNVNIEKDLIPIFTLVDKISEEADREMTDLFDRDYLFRTIISCEKKVKK